MPMACTTSLRRFAVLATAGWLACAFGTAAHAQQQPSIVGTWDWSRKADGCAEEYQFRDNGTVLVFSGAETFESKYRMAWTPESTGRYKLTLTRLKSEGERGCTERQPQAIGAERVFYVLFGGSRQTMILCDSPAEADCIGPLKRNER